MKSIAKQSRTRFPYHRLYADGYGGQRSLGEESYQGAKGGFVFTCPSTGTIKVKLYATSEQFPAILYQILQEVEAEGYSCREIYVDTFKVNFSAAAEEVAAMFRVRYLIQLEHLRKWRMPNQRCA
jgi:hypothetical protein